MLQLLDRAGRVTAAYIQCCCCCQPECLSHLVYCVPTRQHCDGPYAVKKVLEAHRAVLVHAVCHTNVAVLKCDAVAAIAGAAVKEVGAAAHSAYAAVVTVELLLGGVVVEKLALHAAVAPERHAAGAAFCCYWLPGVAQGTDDLRDLLAVKLVPLLWVLHRAHMSAQEVPRT